MANLKTLFKDTAIYGISSIAARFINYLLVPIETYVWAAGGGEFGIITNVYSYIGLLIVILTFGMETTFFRFANKDDENAQMVYSTALRMVGAVALVFAVLVFLFLDPITSWMGYSEHKWYIGSMALCVAIDVWSCILFDYLRYKHQPLKFAAYKVFNILLNVSTLSLLLLVLPHYDIRIPGLYSEAGVPDVGLVFYVNLFCSVVTTLLLFKEMKWVTYGFDRGLCRRMLSYTWPMLILGLVGQLNQNASAILFPFFFDGSEQEARAQLGIYGGCIKIAMIMVIITQAFRFAYEPFVFGSKSADKKETYANAMKYYIIFTLLAYLCVMGYMNVLRFLVDSSYWEGLSVIPIVMAAELMFGIYFNLSFWYKLTDKTIWGAYFSGLGCLVLILMDVLLIPKFSYMACAWAGFAAYGISMVASYIFGQKYYPINYPLKRILAYALLTVILFVGINESNQRLPMIPAMIVNTLLIGVFVAYVVKKDFPLSSLPVVGKFFGKGKV
ncbi:MAG: lipopolysaccharide biosynthesis protein [Bacteroidales bacterium]|nr:lipopolysaccharide biosynthesis protein [Bacteroidales bacterium]